MKNWLNFGGDPCHRLDAWIVFWIRHYWEIREVVNGHKSAAHTDSPDGGAGKTCLGGGMHWPSASSFFLFMVQCGTLSWRPVSVLAYYYISFRIVSYRIWSLSTWAAWDRHVLSEVMATDLRRVLVSGQRLSPSHVQLFLYQILNGTSFKQWRS